MHRKLAGAFASLVVAGIGICQPPPAQGPRAVLGLPVLGPSDPNEINDLKASLAELQHRLNQLESAKSAPIPPSSETTPKGGAEPADSSLTATWKSGLQLQSQDDAFRVHVGGTLHVDSGWNAASQAVQFGPGGTGAFQDGTVLRRARLRVDGTLYQYFDWVAEYDFANTIENDTGSGPQPLGSPSFVNAWTGVNELPLLGTVRVGWMKEPIGLEFQTSGRFISFMERAPGMNSLFMRSPGIQVRNASADERVTWAFEVHHPSGDNFGFGFGDGKYAETGRLTWLPWWEDDGARLLHLGIGAAHRGLIDNQQSLRGRPSVRSMPGSLVPALASTGAIGGTTQDIVDLELAAQHGPWSVQAECYCTWIHDAVFPNEAPPAGVPRGTLFYRGGYVEVLHFLTGEQRDYQRRDAAFGRVVPHNNFNVWNGLGGGAWQVGVRYAYLDLQDRGVNGATLHDIVLGVNWFLNPNTKVQWNFALDHRDSTPAGSSGWTYIFGTRVAVDF